MMAHFAALPNEIVREILMYIQPEDLENFALTSRNVCFLASPFLTKHRALIREFQTLRHKPGSGSIAHLLSTVIAEPRIGRYVKRVELGPLVHSQFVVDSADTYMKAELETFTTAALNSECLKKPPDEEILDEREFWSLAIQDGNEDILLAILLPLLPNLAVLSAEAGSTRIKWYDSAIERAASATKPTLCKLEHISLNASNVNAYHIEEIQRFCALPSVRVLTAPMALGCDCLEGMSPDFTSSITHLKLWDTCIDSKPLYECLRGFPKLQSFTCSNPYYLSSLYRISHDPFLIRSSLLAHCKTTLQSLTLLAPDHRYLSFMGSLRGFETLKEVYTEWPSLISETPNSGGPRLNEHLPASLIRLKIHDDKGRVNSRYERVIKSAQYAKEHRLQKLDWLVFGGTRVKWSLVTIDQGLRKTCVNMKLSLIFSPYAPKSGD